MYARRLDRATGTGLELMNQHGPLRAWQVPSSGPVDQAEYAGGEGSRGCHAC